MASASITITVTDTAQVTLVDFRDTLAAAYGVPTGTSQQKLDAIKAHIIGVLRGDYQVQKNMAALASIEIISSQSDLS